MMLSGGVPYLALNSLGYFRQGEYFIGNHERCLGKSINLKLI